MPQRKLPTLLSRREAALYLSERFFKISASTLARKGSQASGPPYFSVLGQALYAVPDLDEWAMAQLGAPAVRFPAAPRVVRRPLGRPKQPGPSQGTLPAPATTLSDPT